MKAVLIILLSVIVMTSCKESVEVVDEFAVFKEVFQQLDLTDTLNSVAKGWAKGRLYEVESPLLSDSLFYNVVDTSELNYKRWDERLYAEGRIKFDENRTGFFLTRQYEDITHDRTTLLLIFNKETFEKDIVFSEFVGYESEINEIQSKLFKNENGEWTMIRTMNNSYYDIESGESIENNEMEELRIF